MYISIINQKQKNMKIKTIDIQAKEWFDKTYGNSYFSGIITINYGMKSAKVLKMPFQYGYGDHYVDMAFKQLIKEKVIKQVENECFWLYCEKHKIIKRESIQRGCLKRDVINFVK